MSGTNPPAGWHPDPYDPGSGALRWWDGTRWTEHTHPGQAQQQVPTQPTAQSVAPATYPQATLGPDSGAQAPVPQQAPLVPGVQSGPAPAYRVAPAVIFGPEETDTSRPPVAHKAAASAGAVLASRYSMITVVIVCFGAYIAFARHLIYVSFAPMLGTARAFMRSEPIRYVALVASVLGLMLAMYVANHH